MEYGDCQRFFLQALMSKGVLSASQVIKVIQHGVKEYKGTVNVNSVEELKAFFVSINRKLAPLNMKIKRWCDEDYKNSETSYVLCCTVDRFAGDYPQFAGKFMHDFKEREIDYFKLLINDILTSESKELSLQHALNLTRDVASGAFMSMREGQKAIKAFVAKKWLKCCPRNQHVRLSVRFLAVMESYLNNLRMEAEAEEDEDLAAVHPGLGVGRCPICHKIVVRSVSCEQDRCQAQYHLSCIASRAINQDTQELGSTIGQCIKCHKTIILQNVIPISAKSKKRKMAERDSSSSADSSND